jgi:lysophospholipase L1-like esterase
MGSRWEIKVLTSAERPRSIAALGSSFAAGPTIEPVVDVDAMRSARNYPHLLAQTLGAALVDLTVFGATTANILAEPQTTMTGRVFAPQIDGLPADADLVTITAGGNDLQFLGSMLFAAWSNFDPGGPMARMLGQGFAGGIPVVTAEDIDFAATGLAAIVSAVRERAPQARVVLVDYLTVVTERTNTGDDGVFTEEELPLFLRTQTGLRQAYRIVADRSGAELLAVSTTSIEHGLGSDDPWVFGFQSVMAKTAGSFHPNEAGMCAIADELSRIIG